MDGDPVPADAAEASDPIGGWTAGCRHLTSFVRAVHASRVYELARETPLQLAPHLSVRLGTPIWLKREDQQAQYCFKVRGALHCIGALPSDVRRLGVVTASAGNHAQGVALAARHFGIRATVVMPVATPAIKVAAVRALGAKVRLEGARFADSEAIARQLAEGQGTTLVHPFDDLRVIEGQATVAAEIVRQYPGPIAAVLVPVGGGGLIAGVASYLHVIRPEIEVIGVQPVDSDAMHRALACGRPVPVEDPDLFADGVAVRQVGARAFALARRSVSRVILVTRQQICAAMRDVFEEARAIVEPAGALAVAALDEYAGRQRGTSGAVVAILSGGNVDFEVLGDVARRLTAAPSGDA